MQIIKLRAGKFNVPTQVIDAGKRLELVFPFNRILLEEIKNMKGRRWEGRDDSPNPRKAWSIPKCARNTFQLARLMGKNPYKFYDQPLSTLLPNRPECYDHQVHMMNFNMTRRQCLVAGEMGVGKTLAAIETMEKSENENWIWAGPKSALEAVKLEFDIWEAKIRPRAFMTYEAIRTQIQQGIFDPPFGIVGDECTKIKNPTSQRSQAFSIVCDEMREYDKRCFIILMSGAPAPKSPVDWWHQIEVLCPGFLKEGDTTKFKNTLALIESRESITGGAYPELITWWDDERKCKHCGDVPEHHRSDELVGNHAYEPSINQVSRLYKRMDGIVLVKFKKDCLDLPEMQYRVINVEPSIEVKRATQLIAVSEPRTVSALMKFRELSDGFQYAEEKTGNLTTCQSCKGSCKSNEWFASDGSDSPPSDDEIDEGTAIQREVACPRCMGTGKEAEVKRVAKEVPCPKEDVLIDLLDEHEPIGRFVVYAGFRASVDRCVRVARQYDWDVIRVDGRGWIYMPTLEGEKGLTGKDMLSRFRFGYERKIVFIGQAGSAGMGLNLTASPSVFFYSNSFNADDRIQAKERIHRPGMDINRGATVIDVTHLKIDPYILENLNVKDRLLKLTMGELKTALEGEKDATARD